MKEPVKALGYNKMWPGPALRVTEGDKVRINVTNNLDETTGVHMHGIEFDNWYMDGIPFLTQSPIIPGDTFTYGTRITALAYEMDDIMLLKVGRHLRPRPGGPQRLAVRAPCIVDQVVRFRESHQLRRHVDTGVDSPRAPVPLQHAGLLERVSLVGSRTKVPLPFQR